MPKFRIIYGLCRTDEHEYIVEANSLEEAEQLAYEACRELFECQAEYAAEPVDEDES